MHKQLDDLLNRKMDRRVFLKHVGVGVLALFGLSAAMRALSTGESSSSSQQSTAPHYGSGTYGGIRRDSIQ